MSKQGEKAAEVCWFCDCRAWATAMVLPWQVTGAGGLAWLKENSGVQVRPGLRCRRMDDCPMTVWLGPGKQMQRSMLWRYSSRVDFVRVQLVCKVLWQKHVLGKGHSQRTVVVWGSQVIYKGLVRTILTFYLREIP